MGDYLSNGRLFITGLRRQVNAISSSMAISKVLIIMRGSLSIDSAPCDSTRLAADLLGFAGRDKYSEV